MLAGSCGARGGQFGVRVKRTLGPNGSQDDGTRPGAAKELDRHVNLADIDEPPYAQLKAPEAFPVGRERTVVVRAAREEAEVGDREAFARDGLEVEDVQRLAGGLDDRSRRWPVCQAEAATAAGNNSGLPARNLSSRRRSF
jgi:hypothetical protein